MHDLVDELQRTRAVSDATYAAPATSLGEERVVEAVATAGLLHDPRDDDERGGHHRRRTTPRGCPLGRTAEPTPVVLLHPLGVDHDFWDPVRAALPARLGPVEAPDLLGHGRARCRPPVPGSRRSPTPSRQGLSARDAPVHLVGVSLGALVAQVVAARSPERVERLVLADGVAVYPGRCGRCGASVPRLVRPRASAPWSSRWRRCGSPPTTACSRPTQVAAVRAASARRRPRGLCPHLRGAGRRRHRARPSPPSLPRPWSSAVRPTRPPSGWRSTGWPGRCRTRGRPG